MLRYLVSHHWLCPAPSGSNRQDKVMRDRIMMLMHWIQCFTGGQSIAAIWLDETFHLVQDEVSPSRRAAGSGSCISSEFLSACFGVFTLLFGATWKDPTESLGRTVKFRPLILAVVTLTFFHGSLVEELTRSQLRVCVTKMPTFLPLVRTSQVVCNSCPGPPGPLSPNLLVGLFFLVCTTLFLSPSLYLLVHLSCLLSPGLHLLICSFWSVLPCI